GLVQNRRDTDLHRPHEIRDVTWQCVAFLKCRYRRMHRATTTVSEYHDQLCAELSGTKLQASQTIRGDEVTGDPDHEQIAGPLIECQFWSNSRIRAAEDRRERCLAKRKARASRGKVALARLVRHVARIAFDQKV